MCLYYTDMYYSIAVVCRGLRHAVLRGGRLLRERRDALAAR